MNELIKNLGNNIIKSGFQKLIAKNDPMNIIIEELKDGVLVLKWMVENKSPYVNEFGDFFNPKILLRNVEKRISQSEIIIKKSKKQIELYYELNDMRQRSK